MRKLLFNLVCVFAAIVSVKSSETKTIYNDHYKKTCQIKPIYKFGTDAFVPWLLRLKLCEIVDDKPYFVDECKMQRYKFTAYLSHMYESFCHNNGNFTESLVLLWLKRMDSSSKTALEFSKKHLSNYNKTDKNVMAVSFIDEFILSYTTKNISNEKYLVEFFSQIDFTERQIFFRPFVKPKTCAFSYTDYNKTPFTASCFNKHDNSVMIGIFAVDIILAVVITMCNLLVLFVWLRNKEFIVPGYFKVSLAVADFIVGAVVLPGSAFMSYTRDLAILPFEPSNFFSCPFKSFMGFFTIMSVSASILTIFTASVDRFLTVSMPLGSSGKFVTKKRQPYIITFIWVIAALVAFIPIIKQSVEGSSLCGYETTANSLVVGADMSMAIVYTIFLGIPLISMWVLNALLCYKVRTDSLTILKSPREVSWLSSSSFSNFKSPFILKTSNQRKNFTSPSTSRQEISMEDTKEKNINVNQSKCKNM